MTAVLAIKTPGGTLLAGDGCTTDGSTTGTVVKVFRRGGSGVGYAGSVGHGQRVVDAWLGGQSPVAAVRALDPHFDAELLVVDAGEVSYIDSTGGVTPADDWYAAIGSGGPMAMGYLGAHKRPASRVAAAALARRALRFVAARTADVGPPYRCLWVKSPVS